MSHKKKEKSRPLIEVPAVVEPIYAVEGQSRQPGKPGVGSCTDPQGSYTGVPCDGGEPVQDADDL